MVKSVESKREREKRIVSQMIALYCKKKHGVKGGLCSDCAALDAYARQRSDKALLWRQKPSAPTARCTAISPKCGSGSETLCVSQVRECCCTTP